MDEAMEYYVLAPHASKTYFSDILKWFAENGLIAEGDHFLYDDEKCRWTLNDDISAVRNVFIFTRADDAFKFKLRWG